MKIKKLLLAAILIFNVASSKAQDASSGEKKYKLGIGVSPYVFGLGFGGNLKFDYLVNKKLSLGINAMLGTENSWNDYTSPADQYGPGFAVDYYKGNSKAIGLTVNYHVLGENNTNSKFGIYLGSGLSYSSWRKSSTVASLAPTTNSSYYKYDHYFGENNFSLVGTVGFDYKIGKGKAFLEMVNNIQLYGTEFDDFNYLVSPNGGYASSAKYRKAFSLSNIAFINIGYQIYF
jgi:hypothetical protein